MEPGAANNRRRIALLHTGAAALLLLLATTASARQGMAGQPEGEAGDAEVRQYSVELIIFEHLEGGGAEMFLPDAPQDPFDDGPIVDVDPVTGAEILPAEEAPESDTRVPGLLEELPTYEQAGVIVLGPEDYVLDDVYAKLRLLDAYRPLMRAAWVQPTIEKDKTMPIKLRRLGNPPLRLDGTVTLYLSRFLHLVLDLSLEEKTPVRPGADRDRFFGDSRTRIDLDSAYGTPSVFYRLQENRIVRNGELRYYDHPKFGVLAKVTRIEQEQPDVRDDTADLLPGNVN